MASATASYQEPPRSSMTGNGFDIKMIMTLRKALLLSPYIAALRRRWIVSEVSHFDDRQSKYYPWIH